MKHFSRIARYLKIDIINTLFLIMLIICTILSFLGKIESNVHSGILAMCCLFVFGQILSWGGMNDYVKDMNKEIDDLKGRNNDLF